MAAQEYFAKEVATKTPQNQVGTTKLDPVRDVSFPYAFPSPGAYHVWVQLKSGGKIYTGVFEAVVKPAKVT